MKNNGLIKEVEDLIQSVRGTACGPQILFVADKKLRISSKDNTPEFTIGIRHLSHRDIEEGLKPAAWGKIINTICKMQERGTLCPSEQKH